MTARSLVLPLLDSVHPDAPLRLDVAAALAYPGGGMTVSGLRREAQRGRLMIENTAGKIFTTLAAIERMRELCRVPQGESACGSGKGPRSRTAQPRGTSSTASTISPRDA